MRVILLDVMSVDGKLTKWDGTQISEWASKEDFAHFQQTKAEHPVLVMGSKTFNAANPEPEEGVLRIVMTSNLSRYDGRHVEGRLEFTSRSPGEVLDDLTIRGFTTVLLVGGRRLATVWLKQKLVTEWWITIEPLVFGTGEPLVNPEPLDIHLMWLSHQRINQSTILLKYLVC